MSTRLGAALALTRPFNCAAAAALVVLGAYLCAGPPALGMARVLGGALVVGLVVAVCNVVNDCRDAIADRVQNPRRPLPAGRIAPWAAGRLAPVLAVCALALAGLLGLGPLLVAGAALALGVGYSYALKSTVLVGNAVVGGLVGLPLLYAALIVGQLRPAAVFAAVQVALFILASEILNTIGDRESDALAGVGTVTTRLSVAHALRLFQGCALCFIGAALAPALLRQASPAYGIVVVLCPILPVTGVMILLHRRLTDERVRFAERVMKGLWLLNLLPIALLR